MSLQTIPKQSDPHIPEMVPGRNAVSPEPKPYQLFNQRHVIAEGWYWLLQSRQLKRGQVKAVTLVGHELAVYRGTDGSVTALDAYCPHMGAHLAEGKVEGTQLRCFFHNWCYNAQGQCTEIPCTKAGYPIQVATRSWHVQEKHNLIWVWLGKAAPTEPIPEVPELAGTDYDSSLGKPLFKHCHPNVVMINAIDEQHFKTVHHLPGEILSLKPEAKARNRIEFCNQGAVPRTSGFGKLVALFYRNKLTYDLSYWYGSVGTLALGPDFLHLYLMFALRLTPEGRTEGQMLVFTPKRKGPHGWLFNRIILRVTKIASSYFASGDTRIFQTIRFNLQNPTPADRSLVAFINHLEQQEPYPLQPKSP
jgi:phenylpropionate dioxygenase-like ring-hydroxylating dioxygenase large terminal subunit